jgi:hypothetical protein
MKILIIATLISSMAFAAAATCDVHSGSSSVDQLVTLANNNLSVTREITGDTDEEFLPKMVINYLCTTMNNANASSADSLDKFMKALESMTTKMKIEIDDYNEYTFSNVHKFVCKNKSIIQMREKNSLLKYAIDSANYKFIRSAIFIKKDGKNICNPYIDFNRKEIIEGQEETLIDFIDKLLNEDGMDAAHDFNTIKNIKLELTGCSEKQSA